MILFADTLARLDSIYEHATVTAVVEGQGDDWRCLALQSNAAIVRT
jgi:hypothetical protein